MDGQCGEGVRSRHTTRQVNHSTLHGGLRGLVDSSLFFPLHTHFFLKTITYIFPQNTTLQTEINKVNSQYYCF
jgi:hypothetical protein